MRGGVNSGWDGPLFIVGCSRSGTTLLQQMLNAHPLIAIAPETHFAARYWAHAAQYGDLVEAERFERLLDDIGSSVFFPDLGIDRELFLEHARKAEHSFPGVFDALMRLFAEAKGARVRGEKTPSHIQHMALLAETFPGARFIHIVRDPRAVVCSRLRESWTHDTARDNARFWVEAVTAARRQEAQLGRRLATVRYEALVSGPLPILRALCVFAGVEFAPEMLEYWKHNERLVNVAREPWKANALKPLQQEAVGRWERELGAGDVATIESFAWPLMRHFGYRAHTPAFSLLPRVLRRATRDRVAGLRRFARGIARRG